MSAALLVALMREPEAAASLPPTRWNGVITAARAERLLATLAHRLEGVALPASVRPILADALVDAAR